MRRDFFCQRLSAVNDFDCCKLNRAYRMQRHVAGGIFCVENLSINSIKIKINFSLVGLFACMKEMILWLLNKKS